jgi:hypothetical protein
MNWGDALRVALRGWPYDRCATLVIQFSSYESGLPLRLAGHVTS